MPRSIVRLFALSALAALVASVCGCSQIVKPYSLDPDFSVNVAMLRHGWPSETELSEMSAAEREVFKAKGRPDFFHTKWWYGEDITTKSRMYHKLRHYDLNKADPIVSWLYLDKKEWVRFGRDGGYQVEPLPDKIDVICEVGDPNLVRRHADDRGQAVETWTYYRLGRIYKFTEERLTEVDDSSFDPIPNYQLE